MKPVQFRSTEDIGVINQLKSVQCWCCKICQLRN